MTHTLECSDLTPIFAAALILGSGCHGSSTSGYALFRRPVRRDHAADLWVSARAQLAEAADRWDRDHPPACEPRFDASWPGSRNSWLAAQRSARAANVERQARRSRHLARFEQAAWRRLGGELISVVAGDLPVCGRDYDDVALVAGGAALAVIDERGCRCGCGAVCYHEDATAGDLTPQLWELRLPSSHLTAQACGTGRFVTVAADSSSIAAGLDAAVSASARAVEETADAVRKVHARLQPTDEEIGEMTFGQWQRWQADTDVRLPGVYAAGLHWRQRWEEGAQRLAAAAAETAQLAACRAAASAGLFAVGSRLEREVW